jgi:hypothetical protein
VFARLGQAAAGAGLDLVQAGCLGGVHPEERALDAGLTEIVLMDFV